MQEGKHQLEAKPGDDASDAREPNAVRAANPEQPKLQDEHERALKERIDRLIEKKQRDGVL